MTTGIKPDQLIPSDAAFDAVRPGSAPVAPPRDLVPPRRAQLEQGVLRRRLSNRFGTSHMFLFPLEALAAPVRRPTGTLGHDDILRAQARMLAAHAISLDAGLAIDDIYAHPLIRRADILSGHRMRAFIAAPLHGPARDRVGVVCAADTVARRWTGADIAALQQIVAQFEALRLSQS